MHCHRCTTELPAEARYCFRCGAALPRAATGATQRLRRLIPAPLLLSDWFYIDAYAGCVHEYRDEIIFDNGRLQPANVRSLRILVEYVNESDEVLPYRLGQWRLFDQEGFSYESELRVQFYASDAAQRLVEGTLSPGRRVRGWVAFQVPNHAIPDYVQVQILPHAKQLIEIQMHYAADQSVPVPGPATDT